MKTTVKQRKKIPVKIVIKKDPEPKPAVCDICGKISYACWADWDAVPVKWYRWCKKHEQKVKASAPDRVQDNYRVRERIHTANLYFERNEIELVVNGKGSHPSIIKGKVANRCYNAWIYSVTPTDHIKIFDLFDIAPKSRYLVYDEDGVLHNKAKSYEIASSLAGKDKVVVWWGGK